MTNTLSIGTERVDDIPELLEKHFETHGNWVGTGIGWTTGRINRNDKVCKESMMTELLRDPLWQFIGAVIAVIATLMTLVIYALQRQRKLLAYDIQTLTPLLTPTSELASKVQILFENKPVSDVWLVLLRIFNEGNLPIVANDFVKPLEIKLNDEASVLLGEVTDTSTDELDVRVVTHSTCIIVEPLLLNGGDSFQIKILASAIKRAPVVSARIVGVRAIRQVVGLSVYKSSLPMLWAGFVFVITATIMGINGLPVIFAILLACLGVVLAIVPIFTDYRYKRFLFRLLFD